MRRDICTYITFLYSALGACASWCGLQSNTALMTRVTMNKLQWFQDLHCISSLLGILININFDSVMFDRTEQYISAGVWYQSLVCTEHFPRRTTIAMWSRWTHCSEKAMCPEKKCIYYGKSLKTMLISEQEIRALLRTFRYRSLRLDTKPFTILFHRNLPHHPGAPSTQSISGPTDSYPYFKSIFLDPPGLKSRESI